MKLIKEKLLFAGLMLGFGMALAAGPNTLNGFDDKDVIIAQSDYEAVVKQLFQPEEVVESPKACCKIYNSKLQLIYMSRDENDARLRQLKQYCDLIMKTGDTSYFMISEH